MRARILVVAAILLSGVSPYRGAARHTLAAQSYSVTTHVIAGGGATAATGGPYTLGGTIGQADAASTTLAAGPYAVNGGFWATLVSSGLAFTDDPLQAGVTVVKGVHVAELRTRIDALRLHFGLGAAVWTDPALVSGVTVVKEIHIMELRQALVEAYAKAMMAPPAFSDDPIQVGVTPIRAVHITELRLAIQTLETI